MYQTNEKFEEVILSPNRAFHARLIENDQVIVDNIKNFSMVSGNTEITIGSAIASYVEVTIEAQDLSLSSREVTLQIGLEVDGTVEYVPMGLFTIQNPKKESNKISFTAYDRLTSKCNAAYYSKLTYPVDALDLLTEIEAMAGIEIDKTGLSRGIEISKRAVTSESEDVITTYVNPFDGYTYKETIGFVAGLFGTFAVCSRTGQVQFRWYTNRDYKIGSSIFYNDLQETEEEFSLEKIVCDTADETIVSGDGTTGISMQNPVMTKSILDTIVERIKGLQYAPTELRFIGDIRLDIGDVVTVVKNDNTEIQLPVISIQTSYDGGLMQTIGSYGNTAEEDDADTKGPIVEMIERVSYDMAIIKNLMTDNFTATNATIKNLSGDYADFKSVTTEDLKAIHAKIENLDVEHLDARYATIENLNATNANVVNLQAEVGTFKSFSTSKFEAIEGNIEKLTTEKLSVTDANIKYATIENLNAANAKIQTLDTEKLSAKDADLKYANIEFSNIGNAAIENLFAGSGLIKDLVVGDQTITGELVGVTIKGDLIEGNTIVADKLVIKGEDGLYYKLNTNGVATEAQQTEYNSLNGSIITAKSITATKIAVDDLVAFGATIGGFHITDKSIYSGVKTSATNTTRGIYLDEDGQIAAGDATNYLKYYKDQNGQYKLEISAGSISFGAGNKNLENEITNLYDETSAAQEDIKTINASLELKIDTDKLVSVLNASADIIHLKGNRFIVESDNFNLTADGTMTAKNGTFTGNITATSGKIGSFNVVNALYTSANSFGTTANNVYIGSNGISLGTAFKVTNTGALTATSATINNGTFYNCNFENQDDQGVCSIQIGKYDDRVILYANGTENRVRILGDDGVSVESKGGYQYCAMTEGGFMEEGKYISDKYAAKSHSHSYLPLSGGQMTGSINLGHRHYLNGKTSAGGDYMICGMGIGGSDNVNCTFLGNTSLRTYLRGASVRLKDGTAVTSNLDKKHDVCKLEDSVYEKIFDCLNPISYKLNDGDSGRTHIGFGAQHVVEAVEKAGLTTKDFAAVIIDLENGTPVDYCLRYEEFISLNTHMIQKTRAEMLIQAGQLGLHQTMLDDLKDQLFEAWKEIKKLKQTLAV